MEAVQESTDLLSGALMGSSGGHAAHFVEPGFSLYVPISQGSQLLIPDVFAKDPVGQLEQKSAPLSENWPGGHLNPVSKPARGQ